MAGEQGNRRRRVLVVRIGRLGDTVLATPVLETLRRALGEHSVIDFAASPGASSALLELDRRVAEVFPVGRRRLPWPLSRVKRRLRRKSRSIPYDLVINLECGPECDDFHRFVRASEFIGRPFIRRRHDSGRHCVDTEKSIYAGRLGPERAAIANPGLEIPDVTGFQPPCNRDYVVLNPGFSGILEKDFRSHRGWPLEHWRELIGLLDERTDLGIAINGTGEERRAFEPLLQRPGVVSLFGSSLQSLCSALRGSRCLVSIDTGTMHLGMALGTPTVALFGPTVPELTGPYSTDTPFRVLRSGIECQPCFRTAAQRKCSHNRCMAEMSPGKVFRAVQDLLADQPTSI